MKKKRLLLAVSACMLLGACGKAEEDPVLPEDAAEETEEEREAEEKESFQKETEETQTAPFGQDSSADEASSENETGRGNVISDQSFHTSLAPLGEVRFVSYAPGSASGDAVFTIEQNGTELMVLEGMKNRDVRLDESFGQVEAVSFPDYNGDGCDDIMVICRYLPKDGSEAFSEARIYEGSPSGQFGLKKDLSEAANAALAEITIESVKGFLGTGLRQPTDSQDGWQQAYIGHIREHTEGNEGFALIYLDEDDIPELVEVGDCEASGCRIVCFSNGTIKETQLNRLYFSYVEKGNLLCNSEGLMGVYYDYVYRIQDGELIRIAEGNYGLPGDGNMEYDENNEPVYEYCWNGEKMTKEAYERELQAVYNTAEAKDGYQSGAYDSAEVMVEKLEQMK